MQDSGADVHGKCDGAKDDAKYVDKVVSVSDGLAGAAPGQAALLVGLESAREGFGDEGSLEVGHGRGVAGVADGLGEGVDKAEDEEAREGAAEVGDARQGG